MSDPKRTDTSHSHTSRRQAIALMTAIVVNLAAHAQGSLDVVSAAPLDGQRGRVPAVLEQAPQVAVVVCDRQYRGLPADLAARRSGAFRPALIRTRVEPVYTRQALAQQTKGLLSVKIEVLPDGSVGNVCVMNPLHPDLDASVVAAVKAWRWQAATLDGAPVSDPNHSLDFYFDGQSIEARRFPPDVPPDVLATTSVRPCTPDSRRADVIAGQDLVRLARTAVVEMPLVVDTLSAPYPRDVLREGIRGSVAVEFTVRADGSVSDVCVSRSLHPVLDALVVAKAQATRYLPATVDGTPTATRVTLVMGFQFHGPSR
jgi:TonB family protein